MGEGKNYMFAYKAARAFVSAVVSLALRPV